MYSKMQPCPLPEPGAVLSQCIKNGVCDVGAAGGAEGLQLVASTANRDEAVIRYLLLGQRQ